jgi:hypothetical protein
MPGVTLDEVRRQTGFPVVPAPDWAPVPSPTPDELAALEALDPHRLRDLDFQ